MRSARIRRLIAAAFCLASLTLARGQTPARASIPDSILDNVAKSVVHVTTSGCPSGRSATGFVFGSKNNVVSAFHVVAGCSQISISLPNDPGLLIKATIIGADRTRDLVLLKPASAIGLPALATRIADPASNELLEAVGFNYGIAKASGTPLQHRFVVGKTLTSIVPVDGVLKLKALGWPSVDKPVLSLDGSLVPGSSGAPVVDAQGLVVGIADGGLAAGTVSISWAIPADALPSLLNTHDSALIDTAASSLLFSYDDSSAVSAIPFKCGNSTLMNLGSKTYFSLATANDDTAGLSVLNSILSPELSSEAFDVYGDLTSSAGLALPEGVKFTQAGADCVAKTGSISFRVRVANFDSPAAMQTAAIAFMTQVAPPTQGWAPYLPLSYPQPITRVDGMVRQRLTFFSGPLALYNSVSFMTLAEQGKTLLTVAAVDSAITAKFDFDIKQCAAANNTTGQCALDYQILHTWAKAVHAVAFATFPLRVQ